MFDSGLGGITVLKKLTEIMPNENFIFFSEIPLTLPLKYGMMTI